MPLQRPPPSVHRRPPRRKTRRPPRHHRAPRHAHSQWPPQRHQNERYHGPRTSDRTCATAHTATDGTSTGNAHPALPPPHHPPQVGLPHPHLPRHLATPDHPPDPPRTPSPPPLHPVSWHLPYPALRPTPIHLRSLPAASLFAVFFWPRPLRAPPRDRFPNPRRDHFPTLPLLNPWAPPPGDSTVRRRSSRDASRRPPPSSRYHWQPFTHNTTATSTFPHSRHPRTSGDPPPQRPFCDSSRLWSSMQPASVPLYFASSAGCSTTPRHRRTPPSPQPPLPHPRPR